MKKPKTHNAPICKRGGYWNAVAALKAYAIGHSSDGGFAPRKGKTNKKALTK